MKSILGIDVGGSMTKVVSLTNGIFQKPMFISANDPITSFYGAFGKYLSNNNLSLENIEKIVVTGVGSSYIGDSVYGLKCVKASEFECVARGGIYLAGINECVVVSMGTGTANVYVKKENDDVIVEYLGGTGVGGGTILGLSNKLIGINSFDNIVELAEQGNLENVDLRIHDLYKENSSVKPSLSDDLTAANFGKLSDFATNSDIALGIMNMVYESIGMTSMFASKMKGTNNVVLTGNLSVTSVARKTYDFINKNFDINFIIPDNSQFATSMGAALYGLKK